MEEKGKVGIIGVGTMGRGIALTFAQAGYSVSATDIDEEWTKAGLKRLAGEIGSRLAKGKISRQQAAELEGRIQKADIEAMRGCLIIIEAIREQADEKRKVFRQAQKICGPETIYASNTSSLSLTEISQGLDYPVIGTHFFNPAPKMKLVELIGGLGQPRETLEKARVILEDLGKTVVFAADSAGFVVNRLLVPMLNEAIGLWAEGIAEARDIDRAMELGASHPIGPLALADLIGLDICLAVMEVLRQETGDSKYRPHPRLRQLVRAGRLGRKSGQGIYEY